MPNAKTREPEVQRWLSPAAVAFRLGVSRAQVSRLCVKHGWRRLDISTKPGSRNAGVRIALSSVEAYEVSHAY